MMQKEGKNTRHFTLHHLQYQSYKGEHTLWILVVADHSSRKQKDSSSESNITNQFGGSEPSNSKTLVLSGVRNRSSTPQTNL